MTAQTKTHPSSPIGYMSQLDGVRAIAVIAVIIFHLDPKWLPGGYLGVDVFFILSGFLITRILHRDFKNGKYSWRKFIVRRIRRLMPALMTMIAVVTIAGSFLLVFPNRQQLIPQAWAAIFSYSNYFYYFTTSGYWGDDTSSIALLHTWSLAVEEQFYLIYPLLFYAIFKITPKSYKHTITGLMIVASAAYLTVYSDNSDLAFYSLHTRAWQLLLGGSLALGATEKSKLHLYPLVKYGSALGSLLILCCCFFFLDHQLANDTDGWAIIIPCLSATCLIWCASSNSSALKILATKPMTYIGKTSYSLYLWHWPIIVMAKFISTEPSFSVLILITIICAFTSYHLIEKPFRYGKTSILKISICWLALPCVSIALMSQIKSNPLVPSTLKPMMDEGSIQDRNLWKADDKNIRPVWGYKPNNSSDTPLVMINGSSHARVLCGALNEYAKTYQYRFASLSVANAGVTQSTVSKGKNRAEINQIRNKIVEELRPDILFVAGYWQSELKGSEKKFRTRLKEHLIAYSNSADWVIVIGQSPRLKVPAKAAKSIRRYYWSQYLQSGSDQIKIKADDSADKANAVVSDIISKHNRKNVIYIEPKHAFYKNGQFSAISEGRFLYSDRHHINDDAARIIIENIWEQHADKLKKDD